MNYRRIPDEDLSNLNTCMHHMSSQMNIIFRFCCKVLRSTHLCHRGQVPHLSPECQGGVCRIGSSMQCPQGTGYSDQIPQSRGIVLRWQHQQRTLVEPTWRSLSRCHFPYSPLSLLILIDLSSSRSLFICMPSVFVLSHPKPVLTQPLLCTSAHYLSDWPVPGLSPDPNKPAQLLQWVSCVVFRDGLGRETEALEWEHPLDLVKPPQPQQPAASETGTRQAGPAVITRARLESRITEFQRNTRSVSSHRHQRQYLLSKLVMITGEIPTLIIQET